MIKHFPVNTAGRDIAVGDIHGHFSKLESALAQIDFDPQVDRLFSVGDLIDRGPESEQVVDWLAKPWFHPVRGNHESMLLRAEEPGYLRSWLSAGGAWMMALSRFELSEYQVQIAELPLALSVATTQGLVGIVHADPCVDSWDALPGFLEDAEGEQSVMWSRRRVRLGIDSPVAGVRAVIVGHTPVDDPLALGNVYHIDTGGWMDDGAFTFFCLNTLAAIKPERPLCC